MLILAALLRIYLGIDHFTDALFGVILGASIPVAIFRAWAPNDVYPVRYGPQGKAAHLDVSGRRGEAITLAMKEQLGYEVLSMKPVGLEGSGGSTPLKMRIVDDQGVERSVFAKLYAKNHVRADRWYKLGRTMLYGRLEDETPFGTVRRFVEYEDYTLRLLGEKGFSTPAPLDIVEITPEREYLIAMEFFEDAVEISEAEVDEQIIDDGLQLIRRMWDVGLSHRDIKPANLMVQNGRLRLIDVFFVQVRPSPWRQAVDLGNMMLVLALRSDPELVYQRALAYFTPEELSEAFAATRGVASPTQLRASMKADGRDLLATFRGLAPARKPIGIQRWSVRRVLLIVGTLLLLFLTVLTGVALFIPSRGDVGNANCGTGRTMQLMAQAVPTATELPCIDDLPLGWGTEQASIVRDRASFTVGIGSDLVSPVHRDVGRDLPGGRRDSDDPDRWRVRHLRGAARYRARFGAVVRRWRRPEVHRPERAGRRDRAGRGSRAVRRGGSSLPPGARGLTSGSLLRCVARRETRLSAVRIGRCEHFPVDGFIAHAQAQRTVRAEGAIGEEATAGRARSRGAGIAGIRIQRTAGCDRWDGLLWRGGVRPRVPHPRVPLGRAGQDLPGELSPPPQDGA